MIRTVYGAHMWDHQSYTVNHIWSQFIYHIKPYMVIHIWYVPYMGLICGINNHIRLTIYGHNSYIILNHIWLFIYGTCRIWGSYVGSTIIYGEPYMVTVIPDIKPYMVTHIWDHIRYIR